MVVAAAIAWCAGLLGAPVSESLHGGGEPELAELAIEVPSPWIIAGLVLAFLAMLLVRYRSAVVAPRTVEVAPASGPRIWVVFDTVFQGTRREPKLWN